MWHNIMSLAGENAIRLFFNFFIFLNHMETVFCCWIMWRSCNDDELHAVQGCDKMTQEFLITNAWGMKAWFMVRICTPHLWTLFCTLTCASPNMFRMMWTGTNETGLFGIIAVLHSYFPLIFLLNCYCKVSKNYSCSTFTRSNTQENA